MSKFIHVLSAAYALYALFMLVVVVRNIVGFVSTPYIGRAPFFVAATTFVILGTLSVSIPASVSYLLAVRRHRKIALVIAGINCIGFPIGTTLGLVTIYALTRPQVRLAFTPPSNHAMERTAHRCTLQFDMTSTLSLRRTRDLGCRRSSWSR